MPARPRRCFFTGIVSANPTGSAPTGLPGLIHYTQRSTINYDVVEAQIPDQLKFAKGELTADAWVEFANDGSISRLKGITRDRPGRIFQEDLVAGGVETVSFFGTGPRGKTCTQQFARDSARTSLGAAMPADLLIAVHSRTMSTVSLATSK